MEAFYLNHFYKDFQSYSPFFSATDTQYYLKNCYQKITFNQAEQKSYENSYRFIYYLEHAQIYYQQSKQSPLLIQPMLLFYGFIHLIKACLLTTNPGYPENTSVLAHGVSSRKRKKQQYDFFHDEVKFQKHGLFPYMLDNMFGLKYLEGDKLSMEELLQQIPELNPLFKQIEKKNIFIKIPFNGESFSFPIELIDFYHMTENRFVEFIQGKSLGSLTYHEKRNSHFLFQYEGIPHSLPLKYNLENKSYYFSLNKGELLNYPELIFHYLLLYNLSMICRYETEWWSELLKTMPNKDYPFIVNFLDITSKKGPFLVYQYLMEKI
jgi:hypothetical protein